MQITAGLLPTQMRDTRSDFMKATSKLLQGQKLNVCKQVHEQQGWGKGCSDNEIDERGFCKHLVGFTNVQKFEEGATYDPMVTERHGYKWTRGDHPQPLLATDILVQITTTSRVYRRNPEVLKGIEPVCPAPPKKMSVTLEPVEQGKGQKR